VYTATKTRPESHPGQPTDLPRATRSVSAQWPLYGQTTSVYMLSTQCLLIVHCIVSLPVPMCCLHSVHYMVSLPVSIHCPLSAHYKVNIHWMSHTRSAYHCPHSVHSVSTTGVHTLSIHCVASNNLLQ